MFSHLTTHSIIDSFNKLIKVYDNDCISNPPGQEGIKRKQAFLLLIKTLDTKTPAEALISLEEFYSEQNKKWLVQSRMLDMIRRQLMWLLNIQKTELAYCARCYKDCPRDKHSSTIHEDIKKILNPVKNSEEIIERAKVRVAARSVAQLCRQYSSIFLPNEIGIKIAALVTNKISTDEAEQVATNHFCKPLVS